MKNYTLILGESPSKGARSPILWNKTYEHLNIDQKMYPKDIIPDDFDNEIVKIFKDKFYLGGAVAVPFKEKIINYTANKNEIISGPKAVNCLVRKNDKLFGYNTDGIATANILDKSVKKDEVEQIIMFGTGGMGKAVISEVSNRYTDAEIFIVNRELDYFFYRNGQLVKTKKRIDKKLNSVLINCSSAGYFNEIEIGKTNKKVLSAHNYFVKSNDKYDILRDCVTKLQSFKNILFVLDVIYQPEKTILLTAADYLGISNQNGLEINLLQAAIGFNIINKEEKLSNILNIMRS